MKRWIVPVAILVGLLLVAGIWYATRPVEEQSMEAMETALEPTRSEPSSSEATPDPQPGGQVDYGAFRSNVLSGGVPPDGIPPIDEPIWDPIATADQWLMDEDYVFVLEAQEGVYAYPQRILVWHEIVNHQVDGQNHSITYCPLTGFCVGYDGVAQGGLGTSGRLLNSNLVMYDRETGKYWPQILGESIDSENPGTPLNAFPVHWVTWKNFKDHYEEAKVLSTETGYFRDYGRDPYGSYRDENSYYFTPVVMFPTMNDDPRLANKKVVVGIKGQNGVLAIDPALVEERGMINAMAGDTPIVAVYDQNLDIVRVFEREDDGEVTSVDGLQPAHHFDVMWFAWSAYFPDTELMTK